jgi:hypothetical protein
MRVLRTQKIYNKIYLKWLDEQGKMLLDGIICRICLLIC